jgi:hypothetical protein
MKMEFFGGANDVFMNVESLKCTYTVCHVVCHVVSAGHETENQLCWRKSTFISCWLKALFKCDVFQKQNVVESEVKRDGEEIHDATTVAVYRRTVLQRSRQTLKDSQRPSSIGCSFVKAPIHFCPSSADGR